MSFEIYPNKKRFPWFPMLCIFICVLSYFGYTKIEVSNSSDQMAINYIFISLFISAVYFGGFTLFDYLRALMSANAKIIINEEGLIDSLTIFSAGKIKWEEVVDIKIQKGFHLKFLVIYIKEPDLFINKQAKRKQRTLKSIFKRLGSPVAIPINKINCGIDEVQTQIRKYMA